MSLYKVTTVNGHLLPEVVSALQKGIRRGLADDALYWTVDMLRRVLLEAAADHGQ
jgi:hypothetical protein